MRNSLTLAAAMALVAGAAFAQTNEARIARELTQQGFTDIEFERFNGQLKVEADRGLQEIEMVYDTATGSLVKNESRTRDADDVNDDRDDRDDVNDDRDDRDEAGDDRDDRDRDDRDEAGDDRDDNDHDDRDDDSDDRDNDRDDDRNDNDNDRDNDRDDD